MSHSDDRRPFRIRRRDLLAWGGAAGAVTLVPAAARAQAAAAVAPAGQAAPRPMSVGFVEGSDLWTSFRAINGATLARGKRGPGEAAGSANVVVSALELPTGDQTLANESVRIGIHGLYPIPNPTNVLRADLTVFFPSPEPGIPTLPFFAWSYKSKPAANGSPSYKFTAPLGTDGSLQLRFEVTPNQDRRLMSRRATIGFPPDAPGGSFTTDFTVDWFEGRPKLQRGVYLLGLAGNTWSSARALPVQQPRTPRPVELLSLIVSIDRLPE
jgi:hypothetical protein